MYDWPRWDRGDDHCIWYRVYPHGEWDLVRWMLTQTVAPMLPGEGSRLATEAPQQHTPTSLTAHEVFLNRAAKALHECCMKSPLLDRGAASAITLEGNLPTQDQSETLKTAANLSPLTVDSAAVDEVEVPEEFSSLAVAVDGPADPSCFKPPVIEAQRLDQSLSTAVTVVRKACPRCDGALLWTAHSDGRYMSGWACDNHEVCGVWRPGSDLSAEDWWRFCCLRCHSDFCFACAQHLVTFLGSEGENAASLFDAGSAHGSTQAGGLTQA